jgi:hypothetical protein
MIEVSNSKASGVAANSCFVDHRIGRCYRCGRGGYFTSSSEVWPLSSFSLRILGAIIFALTASPLSAQVEPSLATVSVGGVQAALIKPAKPIGSLILLAGGDGRIGGGAGGVIARQGNQLVRTRMAYARKGFAVLVPDRGYDLTALVELMRTIKRPVTVVGTSRGTQWATEGVAGGAMPDKLVMTSGFLSEASTGEPPGDIRRRSEGNAISILGSPSLLPPTLVVHHRLDQCWLTSPAGVAPFIAWAHGKAKVVWLEGGDEIGNPCEAKGHHGFAGIDQKVVEAVAAFAR